MRRARPAASRMGFFKRKPGSLDEGRPRRSARPTIAVDAFLSDTLTAARPDYGWLSEETADAPAGSPRSRIFVVDPIDGTRAFLDGRATWCVSIAVVEAGRPLAGVLDCPAPRRDLSARAGQRRLEGRRAGCAFEPAARCPR